MTDNKNKELLRVIGRRLREASELTQPLSHDIESHLEMLKHIEVQDDAACTSESAEQPAEAELHMTTD